jgi:hypothetical protein
MIQVSGAIQEMELLFFTGCTEVVLLIAAVAAGFVSAMTQLIFG